MAVTTATVNRPSEPPNLDQDDLTKFRQILENKRIALLENAKASLEQDMQLDTNEMPDEIDLASSEYIQSFALRLRGRERFFIEKIDTALKKLSSGEFGTCEDCGDKIGLRRLEARPETTLCIRCKEDQERNERDFR